MRVLVVTSSYPRFAGDTAGIFIHEQARQLVLAGLSVTVIAPFAPGAHPTETYDGVVIRRFRYWYSDRQHAVAYGDGLIENIRRSWLSKVQAPFFIMAFVLSVIRWASQSDIVHAHWWPAAAVALLARMWQHRPIVMTLHGTDVQFAVSHPLLRRIARWVVRRVDHVISVSPRLIQQAQRDISSIASATVIPDMVPELPALFDVSHEYPQTGAVLWVGRLIPVKNIPWLIESIRPFLNQHPTAHLTLVGDGNEYQRIVRLIVQYGLSRRVTLQGSVPHQNLRSYFQHADIVVLPSQQEGFGVSAVEGMASARPVVVTRTCGMADMIHDKETGMVISSQAGNELVAALEYLCADYSRAQAIGQWARDVIRRQLDPARLTQQLRDVYIQATGAGSGAR